MKQVFIYSLECPLSGEVRYVGKATDPDARFMGHLSERRATHKRNWITSLKRVGLRPVMEILEVCTEQNWSEAERFYVAYFRFLGVRLVNQRDGGEGASLSAESKSKVSASLKRKISESPEMLSRLRSLRKGAKTSEETKLKKVQRRVGGGVESFSDLQRQFALMRWNRSIEARSAPKPWEVMGVSRSTFFNRKRNGLLKD